MNVFTFDPKAESMHDCIVNAAVAYTKPETGQVVIHLMNQAIEINGLDHHILCLILCPMNGVLIEDVPSGSSSLWDHTCHTDIKPSSCHPHKYFFFKTKWSYLLLWRENANLRRVWGSEYHQGRTHGISSTMGFVELWVQQTKTEHVWLQDVVCQS